MTKFVLSQQDKAAYEVNGFVKLRGVLNDNFIDGLRDAIDQQIETLNQTTTGYDFQSLSDQLWTKTPKNEIDSGEADRFELELYRHIIETDATARPILDKAQSQTGEKGMFFHDAGGWRLYEGIKNAALDSVLPEICADLLKSSYINFWEDATFVKYPNTVQRTVFHQDYNYFQIEGRKCCVIWIPLDVATKTNGTMQYVCGSHLWGESYAPNMFITQTPMLDAKGPKLPDIEGDMSQYDIRTIDAVPGDVIIHDVRTVHGSGGNLSCDTPRRAISFRYCGDDIRYDDKPGAIPQPYVVSHLKNGDPLSGSDYPLVWPRLDAGAVSPQDAQRHSA